MCWLEGERRDGLIDDKERWNYRIDVISKENLQFPKGATSMSIVKIVLLDAILKVKISGRSRNRCRSFSGRHKVGYKQENEHPCTTEATEEGGLRRIKTFFPVLSGRGQREPFITSSTVDASSSCKHRLLPAHQAF
jgi:hypothetical protein